MNIPITTLEEFRKYLISWLKKYLNYDTDDIFDFMELYGKHIHINYKKLMVTKYYEEILDYLEEECYIDKEFFMKFDEAILIQMLLEFDKSGHFREIGEFIFGSSMDDSDYIDYLYNIIDKLSLNNLKDMAIYLCKCHHGLPENVKIKDLYDTMEIILKDISY